jgi:hypothetical protein
MQSKRLLSLLLVLMTALMLNLTACGGGDDEVDGRVPAGELEGEGEGDGELEEGEEEGDD